MRFISGKGLRGPAVVLFAIMLAAPFLGCSTLGIATTDELTAAENRLQSSSNSTNSRLDNLDKSSAETQQVLAQISAQLDSLSAGFAQAKAWLESMNFETMTSAAENASKAASAAEARSLTFLTQYLEWVKAQHTMLGEQIKTLEATMQQDTASQSSDSKSSTSSDEPPDSGGADDDGGGN